MSVAAAVPPGEPMSWEEYARHSPNPPSEYIDGRLVMVPSPTQKHQDICVLILLELRRLGLTGHKVTLGWAWKVGKDEFIPDVMVHPVTDESARFTGIPLLVVEVLSSNRANDLVLKVLRYAHGGAQNYWIIDPRDRAIDAFTLDEGGEYVSVAHVDAETGPVDIPLGGGIFTADITTLLS